MATPIHNLFTSYSLTADEEEQGHILSELQRMVLQTKLAEIAIQKVNIVYSPEKPLEFAQQISYLQGQIDMGNWLLEASNILKKESEVKAQIERELNQQSES